MSRETRKASRLFRKYALAVINGEREEKCQTVSEFISLWRCRCQATPWRTPSPYHVLLTRIALGCTEQEASVRVMAEQKELRVLRIPEYLRVGDWESEVTEAIEKLNRGMK